MSLDDDATTAASESNGGGNRSTTKTPGGFDRHDFRVTPFVFGLAFAAVGVAGATGFSSDQTTAWLWVVALTVLGLAGIVASFNRR